MRVSHMAKAGNMERTISMDDTSANSKRGSNSARWFLIGLSVLFLLVFLFLPLLVIMTEAFSRGIQVWLESISDPDAMSAIQLTLLVTGIVLVANTTFGIAAAWVITKHDFRGRNFLTTLIDIPFAISPVISGLIYILVFGSRGWLGGWLEQTGFQVIFAFPGIVLATLFVTFPYVARELIPIMMEQGRSNEETALTLGASGWQIFWKVTFPNIRWALLYGIVLCSARAIGEFGAVSVVSGHIRGQTNTMPLHIEVLYNEYNFTAAFAVASLMTAIALVSILARKLIKLYLAYKRKPACQAC
jgi:sulfate transport system permease protein